MGYGGEFPSSEKVMSSPQQELHDNNTGHSQGEKKVDVIVDPQGQVHDNSHFPGPPMTPDGL